MSPLGWLLAGAGTVLVVFGVRGWRKAGRTLDAALADVRQDTPPGPQAPQSQDPEFMPWSPSMSGIVAPEFDPCGAGAVRAEARTEDGEPT